MRIAPFLRLSAGSQIIEMNGPEHGPHGTARRFSKDDGQILLYLFCT